MFGIPSDFTVLDHYYFSPLLSSLLHAPYRMTCECVISVQKQPYHWNPWLCLPVHFTAIVELWWWLKVICMQSF